MLYCRQSVCTMKRRSSSLAVPLCWWSKWTTIIFHRKLVFRNPVSVLLSSCGFRCFGLALLIRQLAHTMEKCHWITTATHTNHNGHIQHLWWTIVYVRLVYNIGNTGSCCATIGNILCINAWHTFLLVVTGSLLVLNDDDDDDDNVNTGSDCGTA